MFNKKMKINPWFTLLDDERFLPIFEVEYTDLDPYMGLAVLQTTL